MHRRIAQVGSEIVGRIAEKGYKQQTATDRLPIHRCWRTFANNNTAANSNHAVDGQNHQQKKSGVTATSKSTQKALRHSRERAAYIDPVRRMNQLARQIDRTMANAFGTDRFHPYYDHMIDESLLGPSPFDMLTELDRKLARDPFFGQLYTQQQGHGQQIHTTGANPLTQPNQSQSLGSLVGLGSTALTRMPTMRCDVHEDTDKYEVSAELPGVPKESIQIDINDSMLVIRAEKKHEYSEIENNENTSDQDKQEADAADRERTTSNEPERRARRYERSYGSVERRFMLPEDVDEEKISASYNDGVLHITIPRIKDSTQSTGRRVEIQ